MKQLLEVSDDVIAEDLTVKTADELRKMNIMDPNLIDPLQTEL